MSDRLAQIRKKKWAFDIPLAGWILSVITFFTGTIVPPLYDRLTFNGIAVGIPYESESVLVGSNEELGTTSYVLVLKVSNANKFPLLIESITSQSKRGPSIDFEFLGAKMTVLREPLNSPGNFPVRSSVLDNKSYLPILVPAESSELYAVDLTFRHHDPKKTRLMVRELVTIYETSGFPISMRINGKLVSYTFKSTMNPVSRRPELN